MILDWIARARSWYLVILIGIATIAVAAATALQLPAEIAIPGKPFLLYFAVVVVSASVLGRIPGYVAVAATSIASALYFEPVYSVNVTRAVDLIGIEVYAVLAAVTVFAFVVSSITHSPKNRTHI
jgi:K+-sensing histidine kinase KdpD